MPAPPAPTAPLSLRTVHARPDGLALALADLHGPAGLTVIAVATPLTASRAEARQTLRHALQHTLAAFLNQPVSAITLLSSPGQPVRVQAIGKPVHVALSHMPGLSVAAISRRGVVGVDVMDSPPQELPDWASVARDYLGPHITAALCQQPPTERPAAFAQAWVRLEARLKCSGLALTEWTPALDRQLAGCPTAALALLPSGVGAVAWQKPPAADIKPPKSLF